MRTLGGSVQRWTKLGLVFRPDPSLPWQRSHAALPAVLPLDGARHRVYFASRDDQQRSHVGWFDIDLDAMEVLDRAETPALAPAPLGRFDGQGVFAASAVRDGDRVLLYTIGWTVGAPAPLFHAAIGLAVSEDGGRTFRRVGRAPLLDRSETDPCFVSAPFVLRDGPRWRMWYLSGTGWDLVGGRPSSRYHVKHAESDDGVTWRRDGTVALDHRLPAERNVARPCVLREDGRYRAWYSADRGDGYRIGYAESADGLAWDRRDGEAALAPSGSGWDGGAVAYPFVVARGDRLVCLYNGDGFGRDGIGAAVCERSRP